MVKKKNDTVLKNLWSRQIFKNRLRQCHVLHLLLILPGYFCHFIIISSFHPFPCSSVKTEDREKLTVYNGKQYKMLSNAKQTTGTFHLLDFRLDKQVFH